MTKSSNRVIVIGAGPVGLCLSLALAQEGIPVCLIEALGDHNFLEQVPRAGTNHPATLELLERAAKAVRSLSPLGERVGVRGLPVHRKSVTPHPTPLPMGEGADRASLESVPVSYTSAHQFFAATTSFTAPTHPVWVRSNTMPSGSLYFAS